MHHHYLIYDEHVCSDQPLDYPISEATDDGCAWRLYEGDLSVCDDLNSWTRIHEEFDFEGGPCLMIYEDQHDPTSSLISYAGWRALIRAHEVIYTYDRTASPYAIPFAQLIERVIAPWKVLSQRDHILAVHGGAVSMSGQAWIFIGESGVGKSSAALELVHKGMTLLSDDMALVDVEHMCVLPGPWVVRMWGSPHVDGTSDGGAVVGTQGQKRRVLVARVHTPSVQVQKNELQAIFVLERVHEGSPEGKFHEMRGAKGLIKVLGQCFDLSHPSPMWSRRRLTLARRMCDELQGISVCSYGESPDGRPAHVEGLWHQITQREGQ